MGKCQLTPWGEASWGGGEIAGEELWPLFFDQEGKGAGSHLGARLKSETEDP